MPNREPFFDIICITQPTSAYDIIGKTMELIANDPQLIYMSRWQRTFRDDEGQATSTGAACGTSACAAGWMHHVAGGNLYDNDDFSGGVVANKLAGVSHIYDVRRACASQALYNVFTNPRLMSKPQAEQADAVICALEKVREEYRDVFEDVMITPSERGLQ